MTIESTTVRELAASIPGATALFERLGIDYCCGGERSPAEACRRAGLLLEEVSASLEQEALPAREEWRDWRNEPLGSLMAHIVDRHHDFTRKELARLEHSLAKVARVHGEHHPELLHLQVLFQDLRDELIPHLQKEEQVLFPYVACLEAAFRGQAPIPAAPFGTVRNPVQRMQLEHDRAGEILRVMGDLTRRYTPPPDACPTYEALYRALRVFEEDLHQHIHLENNLLFPAAVALEREVSR